MEHIEIEDLNSSHKQETTRVELPAIPLATSFLTRPELSHPKIMIQKCNPGNRHNMPLPGHEYDFRQTLDNKRSTSRKFVSGRLRPHVPRDTLNIGVLRLDESETYRKRRHTERVDMTRIPTPVPTEHELHAQAQDQLTENISSYDGHTTCMYSVSKCQQVTKATLMQLNVKCNQ